MEIRYKKVISLYVITALVGMLALKPFVFNPISKLHETRSMRKDVAQMEADISGRKTLPRASCQDSHNGVQQLMMSVLGVINESGCPVISATHSLKKSPESCPIYSLDLTFSGDFPGMLAAISSIDSLVGTNTFDTAVSSCRLGVERSSEGKSWCLVCHETLQCIPSLVQTNGIQSLTANAAILESPFYVPDTGIHEMSAAPHGTPPYPLQGRSVPQGRLVGHIGDGHDVLTIVEIGGECMQLHVGDGILLRDFGDSARVAFGTDTLMIRRR